VWIYVDYKLDESYTPSLVSVRAGNHGHDIYELQRIELREPKGWKRIGFQDCQRPVRTFLIQIAVLANHQNGQDTRIRQVKIHSPIEQTIVSAIKLPGNFSTVEFAQHAHIR